MRFHVLGVPHTVTHKDYVACAFTQKVLKFGKMMTALGHEVIHYGHEDSDLICTEHVTVTTKKDFDISYGNHDWRKNLFKYNHITDYVYQVFHKNAIAEIDKRKKKFDFILAFFGVGHQPVCDFFDKRWYIPVEPGIGYTSTFAPCKVFESYSLMSTLTGMPRDYDPGMNWYDAVIPNYFDKADFLFNDKKEDYFLFLGRVYEGKGVNIAIQATEAIGAKIIIAGQNSLKQMGYDKVPDHVTEIGYADVETRRKLMANAKGAFVASLYTEPFGGVQMELLFSGTPTITTDWGSFTENNIHGVTGYRCRTFEHFTWAAKNINNIKSQDCRTYAENFTLQKVGKMYEEYFQSVLNVYTGNGWYEKNDARTELDWLKKQYSNT